MFYGGVVCASQYGALGGNMVAGETYILLITLYDDWGEVISNPDVVSAACPLLSLDRFSVCLSVLFTPLSLSLLSSLFLCPHALANIHDIANEDRVVSPERGGCVRAPRRWYSEVV